MPKISIRGTEMPSSPIRKLAPLAEDAKKRGAAGIFLQTDNDKPSYGFYHKNGFKDLESHVSLYKKVKE